VKFYDEISPISMYIYELKFRNNVVKKGITTPLLFLLFCFKLEKNLDNKFLYICKDLKNKVLKVNFYQ
jgi:hypothetical protein